MEKPVSIMHISDLHFGKHDEDKVKAIQEFAKAKKPDLICVTGDITQNSRKVNFVLAKGFFDELAEQSCKNIIVIPGNHDAYTPRWKSLSNFKICLGRDLEPSFHQKIKGKDIICLGVDTTESYFFLNTRGNFREKSRTRLETQIDNYQNTLGKNRVKNALKIILVHHHPIATPIIDRFEKTLFFKNAGDFLTWTFNEQVDLVLHGHQHDPIFYQLNSDIGAGGDDIRILSAGTATKKIEKDDKKALSHHAQFYLIDVYEKKYVVRFNNYRLRTKSFTESRVITKKRLLKSPIDKCSEAIKYIMTDSGDLREEGSRTFTPRYGAEIESIYLSFGVDQFSDPCPGTEGLNFVAKQDGVTIPSDQIEWITNGDYEKNLKANLNNKVNNGSSKLTWSYVWPKGFKNLLKDFKDTIAYSPQITIDKIDHVEITFELEHEQYNICAFHASNSKGDNFTNLHEEDTKKRGFSIENLNQIDIIELEVHIE